MVTTASICYWEKFRSLHTLQVHLCSSESVQQIFVLLPQEKLHQPLLSDHSLVFCQRKDVSLITVFMYILCTVYELIGEHTAYVIGL